MEIRSRRRIHEVFADRASPAALDELLASFLKERLMFNEAHQFLSLAVAWRPDLAIRRIRSQAASEPRPSPQGRAQGRG
jgi:hypothetical protein